MNKQASAWQRGVLRWRYLVVILLVMLVAFFLVMRGIARDKDAMRETLEQSNRALQHAKDLYDSMNEESQQVESNGYIENIARQKYAFLKDGELRFEISNPDDLNGYTYEEMQILQEERKSK